MKWLCKIGLHYWRLVGFTSLTLSDSLEECRVCGCGRLVLSFGQAWIKYTPEQMGLLKRSSPSQNCTPSAPPR